MSIKDIVCCTGHSRGLVCEILRGQRTDLFRERAYSLDHHLPWLDAEWAAGQRNGAALWRELRNRCFQGSLRVVAEWATRRRRAEQVDVERLRRVPSARSMAHWLTAARDRLSRTQTVMVAAVEAGVPHLTAARDIITVFQTMILRKTANSFQPQLMQARQSLLASFANGVANDQAAVLAAITSPWSGGQVEGQITKLKMIERQMYGRAKLDLLEARLVQSA